MGVHVDASEWHDVAGEISAHPATVPGRTYDAGRDVGNALDRTAQVLVPRRTGHLAERTRVHVTPLGDGVEVELVSDARYSQYVEDGTSDTAPQPFVGPAFDAHQDDFGVELLDLSLVL